MSTLSLAGTLKVTARWAFGGLHDLQVDLKRPPVARALVGLTPGEALARLPVYFNLCSQAQTEAGRLALAAAGMPLGTPVESWRLWAECLHEHLWRLLLDWPRVMGAVPETAAFAAWRACRAQGREALADATRELLEHRVLAGPLGGLLARLEVRLHVGQGDDPVGAGLEARVQAIRDACAALAANRDYPRGSLGGEAGGRAEGWVHTARGALHHRLRLAGGRVADWEIDAPTDRNFADAIALRRRLPEHLPDPREAKAALERAVLLLDPCVPYGVEIDHA
ncbi:MAG TPA: hypothetical protein PLN96_13970 [Zoogloea sp.]|uniref:hypothetical protein n=1 Tax=Zoogloea sp. TaxID=49181 RepID=UPI002BE7D529|nr:hypothetical protein [Zoogloea sp.]HMV64148.1 hypothetical protein [Rhodocyclaceae bacterium]HMY50678.1 hypothetical protein [Rhodocyclaceae bacterium]HNA68919.1 hypothetical protein [Rhodocyclaceae bacterium]HNB63392.1 hypothetical protein [Rhodocyclaceae bacterium]HNC81036.1 hypothetical protein [Rhodocyclaceae bacterium]